MMGYINDSSSLTGKMLKDLLIGLAVGTYIIFLLYLGGTDMLQQYFSACYTGEAELIEELGEYVEQRKLDATDRYQGTDSMD